MSDIELVIKLDEEHIKQIDRIRFLIGGKEDRSLQINVINAIKNGTPLPKGHGRLGDLNALEHFCRNHEIGNNAIDGRALVATGEYADGDAILEDLFTERNAPTLVQADKQEGEEW